jgi:NAD(P)-dependent dehydrogenase (short-subunit alcohol dehydrogenase family)/ketosteroid isomerase-like protein
MSESYGNGAGRAAIVTGAGRGLGRAMTLGLARAGIRVVATAARERTEIEAVAAEAGESLVLPVIADVSREGDAERVVRVAVERFGRIDILINNAARGMKYVSDTFMTEPTRFWDVEPDTWRMVIDTNVNGPFLMTRFAVRHMVESGWGRIVNVSVSQSTMRRRGFSPYGPSKAALESETEIWAQDLSGSGVTVNALLPGGATLTGMIPENFPQNARAALLDPAIVVRPLLWLVSNNADAVTGCRVNASQWDDGNPFAAIESAGWSGAILAPSTPRALIERFFDHVGRGEWMSLLDFYSDDAVVEQPFAKPAPIRLVGRAAISQHFASAARAPLRLRVMNLRVLETRDPEAIMAEYDYDGRVTTSGQHFVVANVQLFRIKGGKIVMSRDFHDHAAIAAAFGGSPLDAVHS